MAISIGELLEQHIEPHHKVLCVGPHVSPTRDPMPLYASILIGKGSGQVHLLDSQAGSILGKLGGKDATGKLKPKGKAMQDGMWALIAKGGGGAGDVALHAAELNSLRSKGAVIKTPFPHIADAVETKLKDKQFDWVLDAGSYGWICGNVPMEGNASKRRQKRMEKLLAEYERIGHNSIIIGEAHYHGISDPITLDRIEKHLIESGATVKRVEVTNSYQLPRVSPFTEMDPLMVVKGKAKHEYDYRHALIIEFPRRHSHS